MRRVDLTEAQRLLAEGYTYVDVRSEPEYEAGHPPGSYNIPLVHRSAFGARPNPAFVAAFTRAFPAGSKVIVGCASNNRSAHACRMLEEEGLEPLLLNSGFTGLHDGSGRLVEAGWLQAGLEVEEGSPEGRSWSSLNPS